MRLFGNTHLQKQKFLFSVHWPGSVLGYKIIRPLFQWKTTRSLLRKTEGCENNFSRLRLSFLKQGEKTLCSFPVEGMQKNKTLDVRHCYGGSAPIE